MKSQNISYKWFVKLYLTVKYKRERNGGRHRAGRGEGMPEREREVGVEKRQHPAQLPQLWGTFSNRWKSNWELRNANGNGFFLYPLYIK